MAKNVSSAWREAIRGDRIFAVRITVNWQDGTSDVLTDLSDFMKIRITDDCSDSQEFVIGAAVINEASIILNNRSKKFTGKDFYGATIEAKIGLYINGTPEYLDFGPYLVDEPAVPGITVSLVAFDRMVYLEQPYTPGITYPATLADIVEDACEQCDVSLASRAFPRSSYVVNAAPETGHTCREIVAAAAQLAGCFARADSAGRIALSWYSDTVTNEITTLRSKNICTDNVSVTGIDILSGSDTVASSGYDGYRLTVRDNILLDKGREQLTADFLAQQIVGMTFRPLSVTCLSDPSIEAGDKVTVTDETGTVYTTLVTGMTFEVLGSQTVSCNAASPVVNSSRRMSETAAALVRSRKYTDEKVQDEQTARETAMQEFAEQVARASGLYETNVTQQDGSTIRYLHNKRLLADSDIVIQLNNKGFFLSIDGGSTYPYGIDVSATAILNRIYTVGLDAGHINTGSLVGRDSAGNVVFSFNAETGEIWIKSSQIDVSGSQSLDDALSALDTKAGNAQAAAGAAQSTANNAVSAAAAAQSTATGAASTASSANQAASAANQTAGEALQAARDAETNAKALVVTLSRDSFIIPTDSEGSGGDYSGCTSVLSVQWGNEDVTADADITLSDGTGALMANSKKLLVNGRYLKVCTGDITSSWNPSTFTYTVTECRAEIAAATFTVSYNGKTITKKLNIIKAMQGPQGIQGEPGTNGTNGVSIISVDVWYAVSTSSTVAPVSGWSTNQPAWEDGKYIWFKTVTAYSTGSTTESMPACITGSAGYQGETGVGIDLIEEEYYLSTSNTEQVGGSWSSTATWENGKYLWQRLKITYDNDIHTVKYTEPTLAQAINDANQRASDTEEEVRNLEVGTVNLIRVANTLLFDQYYFIGGLLVNGKLLKVNGKHLVTRVAP